MFPVFVLNPGKSSGFALLARNRALTDISSVKTNNKGAASSGYSHPLDSSFSILLESEPVRLFPRPSATLLTCEITAVSMQIFAVITNYAPHDWWLTIWKVSIV